VDLLDGDTLKRMRSRAEGQPARDDPRIERTRARLRVAALEELIAVGWGALTVEGVARRAGAGKASVYRIYGDRTALVVDAFTHLIVQPGATAAAPPPVRSILLHLVEGWNGPLLPALVDAGQRDPDLAAALGPSSAERLAGLGRAVAAELNARADARDPDAVARALAGALLYRRLVVPGSLVPADVDEVLAAVLLA
jgi:AcrR family transcriptional regulator